MSLPGETNFLTEKLGFLISDVPIIRYDNNRRLRFCAIESWRCIDSRASAICLYIKIDMRIKFDGTESKSAGEHRFFHHDIFKPIALAYLSIFLLENSAENCLNSVFHYDHSKIDVFLLYSEKNYYYNPVL